MRGMKILKNSTLNSDNNTGQQEIDKKRIVELNIGIDYWRITGNY